MHRRARKNATNASHCSLFLLLLRLFLLRQNTKEFISVYIRAEKRVVRRKDRDERPVATMARTKANSTCKPAAAGKRPPNAKKTRNKTTKVAAAKGKDLVARKQTSKVAKKTTGETENLTVVLANGTDFIIRRRRWDATKLKWSDWLVLLTKDSPAVDNLAFPLPRGGAFHIYPGLLSEERQEDLTQELADANLFRQYSIQGQDEPRAHFLLHKEATTTDENFDTSVQPGTSTPQTFRHYCKSSLELFF